MPLRCISLCIVAQFSNRVLTSLTVLCSCRTVGGLSKQAISRQHPGMNMVNRLLVIQQLSGVLANPQPSEPASSSATSAQEVASAYADDSDDEDDGKTDRSASSATTRLRSLLDATDNELDDEEQLGILAYMSTKKTAQGQAAKALLDRFQARNSDTANTFSSLCIWARSQSLSAMHNALLRSVPARLRKWGRFWHSATVTFTSQRYEQRKARPLRISRSTFAVTSDAIASYRHPSFLSLPVLPANHYRFFFARVLYFTELPSGEVVARVNVQAAMQRRDSRLAEIDGSLRLKRVLFLPLTVLRHWAVVAEVPGDRSRRRAIEWNELDR